MSVFQPSFYEFLGLPEPSKTNDVKCGCLLAILKELRTIIFLARYPAYTHSILCVCWLLSPAYSFFSVLLLLCQQTSKTKTWSP
jgi:hypothetical protein